MKKFITGVILFGCSALFTFNSCKRTEKDPPVPLTVMSAIKADPSLSIFSTIASFSGDENYINNSKSIVIPVDSAFKNAGITAKVAASLSGPECDSIVMYYTIIDGINFNATACKEVGFNSGLGPVLFGDSTKADVYFDGIAATSSTPARAGKSSIYKLTQIINMPSETISEIAASDSSLSFFNAAFDKTGLAGTLSEGSFTLLMPTNNAFKKAGYPDIKSIENADVATLREILLYQAIPKNYFENDLKRQNALTTLQGKSVRVSANNRLKLFGKSNPASPASLLNSGTLAQNVLTYKTNNVLLP
jgi:uncharacterized surface protein with fasciclin (FAS1) repeats